MALETHKTFKLLVNVSSTDHLFDRSAKIPLSIRLEYGSVVEAVQAEEPSDV